ncbi:uncharacterized protein N7484_010027 [Penicillium longicatenatum]|uniref:uncharacterized protein n=1 Tax=Penicillium longicatenatum TaxID=1561947 RepID=UPI0025499735|nr:uncharacterized protein N7484_010027 [Penicillium longicatenatum]KAJ5636714.1 hypothetical protein N7484_010027 [Penicillium longicatenatum]
MAQIAILTGGSSGIGLDVAQRLNSTANWKVHIIGSNKQRGETAASRLNNATFHQADITNYQQQAAVFDKIFAEHGRVDFVFANAGIGQDPGAFFSTHETGIPPEPNIEALVDTNFNGAIHTSYLAMHYFRRSPPESRGGRHLILTSSIGGFYPCVPTPIYSATKHGLVGFTRSIGKKLAEEGVKVNAICPGVVETSLLTPELKAIFGKSLVPISNVTDVVMGILSGNEVVDSKGVIVSGEDLHSRTILISGKNHYFVEMPGIYDEESRITLEAMMG